MTEPVATKAGGRVVETLTSVAAQAAAIGAFLYYFGYTRTQVMYHQFGIDMTLLSLSPPELILRSLNTVVVPLIVLTLAAVAARMTIAGTKKGAPDTRRQTEIWFAAATGAGILLALAGVVLLLRRAATGSVLISVGATCAAGTASGGLFLVTADQSDDGNSPSNGKPGWQARRRQELRAGAQALLLLTGVGFLITVGWFAVVTGKRDAVNFEHQVAGSPTITVHADRDLGIDVKPGGAAADNRFGFVYTNLRLIIRANGRYFLVNGSWKIGGPVYVIPDDEHVRIDINLAATRNGSSGLPTAPNTSSPTDGNFSATGSTKTPRSR